MSESLHRPKLRRVDIHPSVERPGAFDLTDPTGIAPGVFTVSAPVLSILAAMDGEHDRPAIQFEFMRRCGRMLLTEEFTGLLDHLDETLLLDSPRFEAVMGGLLAEYRQSPSRPIRDANSLGAPVDRLGAYLDLILNSKSAFQVSASDGRLVGLVAPHLDYGRGSPCYAAAYHRLAQRTDAVRFVILGTNHFGGSAPVIATAKDFDTPFGVVPHDGDFIRRVNRRLDVDLCEREYDHVREHSIELQVILLRHLLGDRAFTIVPYLCLDLVGADGTVAVDGVGLGDFAAALRAEVDADSCETLIIAAADLSHVGRFFQDNRDLDADNLHAVEASDRDALEKLITGGAEPFRSTVAGRQNDTHICSMGCLQVLAGVLDGRARGRLLGYHQAVTPDVENCVTCAAIEFTAS